jgi:uncharacterized membrane protein
VSGWGLAGSLLGAAAVAAFAIACGWPSRAILPIVIGGIVGSLADSLLGATVQSRRRCPTCDRATERRIHDCGTATRPDGGWEWLDNDAVNFASCLAGALAGGWAGRVLGAIS